MVVRARNEMLISQELRPCATLWAALLATVIVANSGLAALNSYEPFDYTPGVAGNGLNGGTGWNDAWTDTLPGIGTAGTTEVLAGGLTYADGAGNELLVSGGALSMEGFDLSFAGGPNFSTIGRSSAQDVSGSYWISFLFESSISLPQSFYYYFGDPDRTAFGRVLNQEDEIKFASSDAGASSTTIDAGTTYLLVANLVNRESELENAGHNRLWINPNLSSLGTPDATSDGTGFGSGSVYSAVGSFFYSAEENATFKLDEVRWGDSMDDVLPIDDDGGNGTGGGIDPDFNNDGFVDGIDVDSLVAIIVSGANSSAFDMNQDTVVDIADLDTWRVRAGAVNLGAGIEYLRGDANLDGAVDVRDFNAWNRHRDGGLGWTQGDFNASGVVDNADFLIWNGNKFGLASSTSLAVSVPEPTTGMLLLMTLLMCLRGARGFRLDRDLPVG